MSAQATGTATTRVVTLARRPGGEPVPDDFAIEEVPVPELAAGQLLVRNAFMSVDPSMRGRLEETEKHYTTNFQVGEPLDGSAVGRVVASADPSVPVGACVRHRLGWRDLAVVDAAAASVVDEGTAPLSQWLGVLGQTGFTAYVGLVRSAELRAGDVVFVSAAAGAVGSAAAQFARLLGASRGGRQRWWRGEGGAADRRAGPGRSARLPGRGSARGAAPGSRPTASTCTSTTSVATTSSPRSTRSGSRDGRVALCGMISQFDATGVPAEHRPLDPGGAQAADPARLHRPRPRGPAPGVRGAGQRVARAAASWCPSRPSSTGSTARSAPSSACSAASNVGKMLVRLDAPSTPDAHPTSPRHYQGGRAVRGLPAGSTSVRVKGRRERSAHTV